MNTAIVLALVLGIVAVVMLVVAAGLRFRDQTRARLGVPASEPETAEVVARLFEGDTVGAIKLYRRRTGASLLDAKNAVEEMARRQDG